MSGPRRTQPGALAAAARSPRTATALLAAAMLVSGGMLIALGSRLSFLLDDWAFIIYRRGNGLDDFLRPDNEHLVAGATAVWKLLLGAFGIGSTVPYRVVSTAMFLLGVWFMFVWIRRRLGEWAALFAAVLVLFLGAAFDDFLWFSSITFLGSMLGGMGMLVALDRRDRKGDVLACVGLTFSLLFSSLWVAFAAGAVVDIALRRERSWRRRLFVVAVPVALYAIWWLGWGRDGGSSLTLHNLGETPLYVLNALGAALAALLGLATPVEGVASPNGLDWGRPLAVAAIGLGAWRLYRLDRIPRSFWVVAAVGLSFWVLGGLDVKPGRVAWASRYQYPSGVFLLLMVAPLLPRAKLDRRLVAPALVVAAAAVASNVLFLHESYQSYRATSQIERADLAAVEIARGTVEPGFFLDESIAGTGYVPVEAGAYLAARDAYGSPAFTVPELEASPEAARTAADRVLAAALGLAFEPYTGPAATGCEPVAPAAGEEAASFEIPNRGLVLENRGSAAVKVGLRRFGGGPGVATATLEPDSRATIAIPTDAAPNPWQAVVTGPVDVCSAAP